VVIFPRTFCVVALSAVFASALRGAPTVDAAPSQSIALTEVAWTPETPVTVLVQVEYGAQAEQVVRVARALQAPTDPSSASAFPVSMQSLPPLPSPVWLVLAGFLPFTWIRDRKRWVAMVTGVLWLGQVGLAGLPKLAGHGARPAHQTQPTTVSGVSVNAPVLGARGLDREYAALLYRLAGARPVLGVESNSGGVKGTDQPCVSWHAPSGDAVLASWPGVDGVAWFVSAVRQFHIFSPGFCFINLARGPPVRPLEWGTFPVCVGGPQRAWPFGHAERV